MKTSLLLGLILLNPLKERERDSDSDFFFFFGWDCGNWKIVKQKKKRVVGLRIVRCKRWDFFFFFCGLGGSFSEDTSIQHIQVKTLGCVWFRKWIFPIQP